MKSIKDETKEKCDILYKRIEQLIIESNDPVFWYEKLELQLRTIFGVLNKNWQKDIEIKSLEKYHHIYFENLKKEINHIPANDKIGFKPTYQVKLLPTTETSEIKSKPKPNLYIIDLFSGIGASTQALLKRYNVRHIDAVDFDKFAMKSFNELYGTHFQSADILTKTIDGKDLPYHNIDLLHMSPPCQKFSSQGLGGGDTDETTQNMWDKCVEYIDLWKPNFVSYENVKQTADKSIFYNLNSNLLKKGYNLLYASILNAKDFGLPQNRERYFVMWVKQEIFTEKMASDMWKNIVKKQTTTPTLETILDFETPYKIANAQVIKTLLASSPYYKDDNSQIEPNKLIFTYDSDQQSGKAIIIETDKLKDISPKSSKHIVATIQQEYDLNLTLNHYNKLKFNSDSAFLGINGISGTITAQSSAGFKNKIMWCDQKEMEQNGKTTINYRNLTTLELGRLQGFSDETIKKLLTVNSEAQVKKQIGNSIAVNVLEALYNEIEFEKYQGEF